MTIKNLENLEIWKEGLKLGKEIYELTEGLPRSEDYNLKKRLRENARGFPANISECFYRHLRKEKLHFYSISRDCLGEMKSDICFVYKVYPDLFQSKSLKYYLEKIDMLGKRLNSFIKTTVHFPTKSTEHTSDTNSGFTLIELLVVSIIIIVISAISIPGYQSYNKELRLSRSAYLLSQEARKVLGMSMSAKEMEATGEFPKGGYGLYLEESPSYQIFVFADCNNDQKYTPGNNRCGSGVGEKIADINLEQDVVINFLSVSPLNVVFKPPDPVVFIDQKRGANANDAEITLGIDSKEKKVIINRAGSISIGSP